jgi:hypothetical protein
MRRAAYHYHRRNRETRGFDFGAAVDFDVQIIQSRVAFDDGFGAFSFWLNGGLASRASSKTRQFFNHLRMTSASNQKSSFREGLLFPTAGQT